MSGHAGAGDSDSDDGAFIDQLRLKHSLREGTRIAVASTGKQNKTAKGSSLTGGGSFQSMGACWAAVSHYYYWVPHELGQASAPSGCFPGCRQG